MNEMDSVGVGIVEMSYNCLFYGVVGKLCLQDVGKLYFAFPCAVNIVIHDGIGSYAHFHDAFSRKHKAELSHRVLDKLQNITDEEFANLNLEVAE